MYTALPNVALKREKNIVFSLREKVRLKGIESEKYNYIVYNIICNKSQIFYNFSRGLILALNLACTTLSIYKLNFLVQG